MQTALWLVSLLTNVLLLTAFFIFVAKRGGLAYLSKKLQQVSHPDPNEDFSHVPFYVHRLSQFELLDIKPSDVVLLGDSLTNEGEWAEFLSASVKNRAISGDTTAGLLQRLEPIVQAKPHKVFLMIGINDIIRGVRIEQIVQNYTTILTRFRTDSPSTRVYVQSLLPVGDRRYCQKMRSTILEVNQILPTLAQQFDYQYIDLYPQFTNPQGGLDPQYSQDELHLNGKAYDRWRQLIQEFIVS